MIKILFLGPLGRFMPSEDEEGFWSVDAAGKTVAEIVSTTEVSGSKMNYAVLINDVKKTQDTILEDGDEVSILPLFFAG